MHENKCPVHWFNTKYKSMKLEIFGNLSCNVTLVYLHLPFNVYSHFFIKMRDWHLMHLKIVEISVSPSTTSRKSLPSYLSMNKYWKISFFVSWIYPQRAVENIILFAFKQQHVYLENKEYRILLNFAKYFSTIQHCINKDRTSFHL